MVVHKAWHSEEEMINTAVAFLEQTVPVRVPRKESVEKSELKMEMSYRSRVCLDVRFQERMVPPSNEVLVKLLGNRN
jgi:hypothetical protein